MPQKKDPWRIIIPILTLLLLISWVAMQKAKAQQQTDKNIPAPIVEREHGELLMVHSELWLNREAWRFGKIDRERYFLIVSPGEATRQGPPSTWLVFIGSEGPLTSLRMRKDPQFDPDGSVTFHTSGGVFFFPVPSRGKSATFRGKPLLVPVLEFGTAIPRDKAPRPTFDSCPLPTPTPSPEVWKPENVL